MAPVIIFFRPGTALRKGDQLLQALSGIERSNPTGFQQQAKGAMAVVFFFRGRLLGMVRLRVLA